MPRFTCSPDDPRIANLANAYRAMASQAQYRPAAPYDDELDLDEEAYEYAVEWREEEQGHRFFIGCTDFGLAPATVYAVEAARALCTGSFGVDVARRLLTMALTELEAKEAEARKLRQLVRS
jgi:hypothetical protein